MNYVLLIISVSLAVIGQLLMKYGMKMIGTFPLTQLFPRLISIVFNPFVFAGLAAFALSAVFWLAVLSRFDLSMAYPLVSLGYIIVVLVSMIVFKEPVGWVRWMGVAAIVFGVILVSRS
ncbi:MAG: EamA family transporter [Candidatus Margulisiibacteriota bacterium]